MGNGYAYHFEVYVKQTNNRFSHIDALEFILYICIVVLYMQMHMYGGSGPGFFVEFQIAEIFA